MQSDMPHNRLIQRAYRLPVLAFLIAAVSVFGASNAVASNIPADPFGSVMWNSMVQQFFSDGEVVFDQRVKVTAPASAEDQFNVPVTVDASELDNVVEIVAVADLNPIPRILAVRPQQALSFVGFRVKLQQSTVIHVGARTADGVWHIGGAHVDAAGGGCTAPAMAHGTSNWMKTLGNSRAIALRQQPELARMTLRMQHPMDTGLAPGIPAFYMSSMAISDDNGNVVADIDLYEPVSENPTLTLKPRVQADSQKLHVSARDTEGNEFGFPIPIPPVVQP